MKGKKKRRKEANKQKKKKRHDLVPKCCFSSLIRLQVIKEKENIQGPSVCHQEFKKTG